jgi:hypothetical protein
MPKMQSFDHAINGLNNLRMFNSFVVGMLFFAHRPGVSLPGTCSPEMFELSMQGLNFKFEYWLQFVETFGDIHPSMQQSQNKNGIRLYVANKKVPIDAMEVQRLMKIRFCSQNFRVIRNSLQCSLDLIKVIIGNSIPPGPDTVFLNGDQVLQSLIGKKDLVSFPSSPVHFLAFLSRALKSPWNTEVLPAMAS